jgi:hypothetical protein
MFFILQVKADTLRSCSFYLQLEYLAKSVFCF